jgi:hypothetical protein
VSEVSPDARYPNEGAISELEGWLAGDLSSAVARLYISPAAYDPADPLSAYVEASFPGYAPQPLAPWKVVTLNLAGKAETDSTPFLFQWTGSAGTTVVQGIYVTDAANTKVLIVVPFLSPFSFSPSARQLAFKLAVTAVGEL